MEFSDKTYQICLKCGYFSLVREDLPYCSRCGSSMEKECNQCGMEFDDPFARFCKRCGEKLWDSEN